MWDNLSFVSHPSMELKKYRCPCLITQKAWFVYSGFRPLHFYFSTTPSVTLTVEGHFNRAPSSSIESHGWWGLRAHVRMGCNTVSWYYTCVVAVEVVLLLEPHICWNCTLISANVSMMTAINTFWKKITNHIYQRLEMRKQRATENNQKFCRNCQKT